MTANLKGASLIEAHLEGALLARAHLQDANPWRASLERAKVLTSQQLKDAATVSGAIMPDGIKLKDTSQFSHSFAGPTLEEWLATKPTCLVDWDEEETYTTTIEDILAALDEPSPEDDQE